MKFCVSAGTGADEYNATGPERGTTSLWRLSAQNIYLITKGNLKRIFEVYSTVKTRHFF
jgi:hypothetical protein